MGDQAPLVRKYEVEIPATAASATFSGIIRAEFDGTVTAVTYVPVSDITGANTNSRTLSLTNKKQDGNGTTSVATLALVSGVNASDYDEKALTLTATAADRVVAEGDILQFASTAVGTGIADPGGTAFVTISRN